MKRTIGFKNGIMGKHIAEKLICILPELEGQFRDIKTYGDVVFDGNNLEVRLDMETFRSLTEEFSIRMDDDFIEVEV